MWSRITKDSLFFGSTYKFCLFPNKQDFKMEQLKQFRRRLSSSDKGRNDYNINPSEPCFDVRYLGMSCVTEDFEPAVNGHILASQHVEKMQQDCKAGKTLRKVSLCVSANNERGLTITDALTKCELSFQLHNIAYCCTNKDDPKIFSLIVEREDQLQCHGFIASKEAKARAICLALSKAFTTAYEIWSKKMKKLDSKKERFQRKNLPEGTVEETNRMDVRNTSNPESAELG